MKPVNGSGSFGCSRSLISMLELHPAGSANNSRGNVGGQSFLCRTALLPELAGLPDRSGTGRIDVIAVPRWCR